MLLTSQQPGRVSKCPWFFFRKSRENKAKIHRICVRIPNFTGISRRMQFPCFSLHLACRCLAQNFLQNIWQRKKTKPQNVCPRFPNHGLSVIFRRLKWWEQRVPRGCGRKRCSGCFSGVKRLLLPAARHYNSTPCHILNLLRQDVTGRLKTFKQQDFSVGSWTACRLQPDPALPRGPRPQVLYSAGCSISICWILSVFI